MHNTETERNGPDYGFAVVILSLAEITVTPACRQGRWPAALIGAQSESWSRNLGATNRSLVIKV
jgi:hypothetical protein